MSTSSNETENHEVEKCHSFLGVHVQAGAGKPISISNRKSRSITSVLRGFKKLQKMLHANVTSNLMQSGNS